VQQICAEYTEEMLQQKTSMTATTLHPQLKTALMRQLSKSTNRKKGLAQKGFTLVELMIVIIIVGILSAVALPNFLNTRSKAEAGSLIGTMSGFAKECATNAITQDTSALSGLPTTVTVTPAGSSTICSAGAAIKNTTPFTAGKVVGLRCGVNSSGVAQIAVAASTTCTLTVDANGGTTGAWS
jgi:type IV pilus assembly protein PilA